jgi:hypothetical protein
MRSYYNQPQFNGGVLGRLLRGRRDRDFYGKGCKVLTNFRPSIQGAAIKRKGTRYVGEVKTNANKTRLIPFIFDEDDSVVLEFGNLYIRFYKDGEPIMSGMSPYEIVSPYATADLPNIKYDQYGNLMYLAAGGKSIRPQKLTRISDTSWTIASVDNKFGPVLDVNETATLILPTGTLTVGGTSTWTAGSAVFQAAHVGSVWGIQKDSADEVRYARMASFISSSQATFTNQSDMTHITLGTSLWYEASWSGVRGYPYAVTFHEDRLYWGGLDLNPLDIVGSVVGSYENYDIDDASADDGLHFNLAGQTNLIQWMRSDGSFMVCGTLGGLGFVEIDISNTTINPRARVGSNYGSAKTQGIKINDQIVYLQKAKRHLFETEYNDVSLKYVSTKLTAINNDILVGDSDYIDAAEQPDVAVYIPSDGGLKGFVREPTQEVAGWYEYTFGGTVESVAIIPSISGDDQIWMVIKRTIDGSDVRYVEYIDNSDEEIYLDSSITYTGTATRSLTGLDHLEGETVTVWGDGAAAGSYVVASGAIAIPDSKSAVAKAHIGLAYNADLEIMPIEAPSQNIGQTSQTLLHRVNEVGLIVYNTLGLQIGRDFDNLKTIPFRSSGDSMDAGPPKAGVEYPTEIVVSFDGEWTRAATVCLRSSDPFPCTLISLMARLEVNPN